MGCSVCGKVVEGVPEGVGVYICAECNELYTTPPVEEEYPVGEPVIVDDGVVNMDNAVVVKRSEANSDLYLVFDSGWVGYTEGNLTDQGDQLLPGVTTGFRWVDCQYFQKVDSVDWNEEEGKPERTPVQV